MNESKLASENTTTEAKACLPKKRHCANKQHLGSWLIEHLSDTGELPLPERKEPEREIPFQS